MEQATESERSPAPPLAVSEGAVAEGAPPRRRDRTCVGCRLATDPELVVRWVLTPDGSVVPDLARRAHGRGAWVHPRPDCLREAAKRGLSRTFRAPVRTSQEELTQLLRGAADRRIEGLLSAAWRGRKLSVGADPVAESLAAGKGLLVVLARDARAAADGSAVAAALVAGRVQVWGTKADIGRAVGRAEVGVVAIEDPGFAQALSTTLQMAQMPAPAAEAKWTPAGGSTEDG